MQSEFWSYLDLGPKFDLSLDGINLTFPKNLKNKDFSGHSFQKSNWIFNHTLICESKYKDSLNVQNWFDLENKT